MACPPTTNACLPLSIHPPNPATSIPRRTKKFLTSSAFLVLNTLYSVHPSRVITCAFIALPSVKVLPCDAGAGATTSVTMASATTQFPCAMFVSSRPHMTKNSIFATKTDLPYSLTAPTSTKDNLEE
ncbi:hypothetical protein VFPPC_00432 [Pochonia chlamydosporia 170]|uniref:Uncharacterized protein n=1 Tax=Pochonia chlamydosporia 170 TaxID=1380566 RepID=A0A179G3M2_METCM|nr:hypothetical protein VFPPC_00432 [Pochonia chlamydosporia 170]OAQ72466.1 hypothetical protein VFPPC_00432 [Pochonia chlamydosporia 170]